MLTNALFKNKIKKMVWYFAVEPLEIGLLKIQKLKLNYNNSFSYLFFILKCFFF